MNPSLCAPAPVRSQRAARLLLDFLQVHRMGLEAKFETLPYCIENCSQVIHAWIAFWRQHPMETLARRGRYLGQSFKAESCIHEIAQNETCRLRLATQKQRCRLIQERLRERGIALDASDNCLLEIASKRHCLYLFRFLAFRSIDGGAFRALYSAWSAFARSISDCCRRLVPPPNNTISDSPSFAR